MKQLFILTLVAVLACTACSDDRELGNSSPETTANAIGFQVIKKNVLTRSGSTTSGTARTAIGLEDAGHYNFGVFAYKDTQADNDIMANYLVGYFGVDKGYHTSTTLTGSKWAYEGLGNLDYTYSGPASGTDNFYKQNDTYYMSNIDNQYLRYWDKSAPNTSFYAYAPYINGSSTVTFDNSNKTMTFPAGTIQDGYDDRSKYEYMYATTTVASADYGNDVQLQFNRLTAKVKIKFYEDIAGYQVKMLDLGNGYTGVCAAPAKRTGDASPYTYEYGTLYQSSSLAIDFSRQPIAPVWSEQEVYKKADGEKRFLRFDIPQGDATNNNIISSTNSSPSESATTYYAIPKNEGGLTFHVSYQLISTTGETINVYNAKVFVPEAYCKWQANYSYTYIFKITKNSSGTTVGGTGIDPSDPDPKDGEHGLFPIVFNSCTVEDWTETSYEENINN